MRAAGDTGSSSAGRGGDRVAPDRHADLVVPALPWLHDGRTSVRAGPLRIEELTRARSRAPSVRGWATPIGTGAGACPPSRRSRCRDRRRGSRPRLWRTRPGPPAQQNARTLPPSCVRLAAAATHARRGCDPVLGCMGVRWGPGPEVRDPANPLIEPGSWFAGSEIGSFRVLSCRGAGLSQLSRGNQHLDVVLSQRVRQVRRRGRVRHEEVRPPEIRHLSE